ncbi:hypothetical protein Hanom_Chr03g00277461 [Helianthus anomalus]
MGRLDNLFHNKHHQCHNNRTCYNISPEHSCTFGMQLARGGVFQKGILQRVEGLKVLFSFCFCVVFENLRILIM